VSTSVKENRSIFSKDMDKSIVSPFLTHGVDTAIPPRLSTKDRYSIWWLVLQW